MVKARHNRNPSASSLDPTRKRGSRKEGRRSVLAREPGRITSDERSYRSFFENAVEGIFQSTPDGRYLRCNPALARMYGYASPRDLIHSVDDIQRDIYIDPSVRDEFKARIERDGRVIGLEYQIRRKDKTVIWICEHARAVHGPDDRLLYYEGTIQDITRRKEAEIAKTRLEAQLLQSQKLEAIGTLAGGIAHDFNNILGAIQGFTEMAQDEAPPNGAAYHHLKEVLTAVSRAKEVVKQILMFSRSTEAERQPVRMSLLVAEVLKLMNATLPASIRCRSHLRARADWVLADANQLHQVLVNLCTNAGYAMRAQGGALDIYIYLAPSKAATGSGLPPLGSGRHLQITVSDTGCGMKPEVRARIFEPFFTTKPLGEGTGLGLSVAHGIIQNHGGAMTVESTVGQGTRFHLFLPLVEKPNEARSSMEPPIQGHRERILFVDDEDSLIAIAQNKLRRLGYRVATRSDSLEALRTLRQDPLAFDVVVTDQTMPHLLGADLCREIKSLRPELPVILCSGQAQLLNKVELAAGAIDDFLPKPLDFAALSRAIQRALRKKLPECAPIP